MGLMAPYSKWVRIGAMCLLTLFLSTTPQTSRAGVINLEKARYSQLLHDWAAIALPDWHQVTSAVKVPLLGLVWDEQVESYFHAYHLRTVGTDVPAVAELSHVLELPSIHAP